MKRPRISANIGWKETKITDLNCQPFDRAVAAGDNFLGKNEIIHFQSPLDRVKFGLILAASRRDFNKFSTILGLQFPAIPRFPDRDYRLQGSITAPASPVTGNG